MILHHPGQATICPREQGASMPIIIVIILIVLLLGGGGYGWHSGYGGPYLGGGVGLVVLVLVVLLLMGRV